MLHDLIKIYERSGVHTLFTSQSIMKCDSQRIRDNPLLQKNQEKVEAMVASMVALVDYDGWRAGHDGCVAVGGARRRWCSTQQ